MMFWQRKKGMIDVGKMAQRGQIRVPKKDIDIPTNKEGFVEVNSTLSNLGQRKIISQAQAGQAESSEKKESSGFFDFLGFGSSSESQQASSPTASFSTEENGYSKREVDIKIEELDNKIYKLEQRIELLERKIGVGSNW
jgi:hypothetical protein